MATMKCSLLYPKKLKAYKSMTLHQLQAIEEHISTSSCSHPPLKDFVFKGRLKGSNPLLLACHHGDLDSVKHIVENWGADIQAKAVYYYDLFTAKYSWCILKSIQGATPLFVAACNGHIDIVRYLVEKGANVSAKTSSKTVPKFVGLTPLHGAVMDLWWEDPDDSTSTFFTMAKETRDAIVIFLLESGADPSTLPSDGTPIWMRSCCGAKAVTTLINHGLDLNQRNRKGQTILHVWSDFRHFRVTEEESLAVIKLILEKGANYLLMARDHCGLTPILEAVLCENSEETNEKVLNFLLESDSIDRLEKIDALELACAVIHIRNPSPQAFEYWRRALRLRMNQDPPIHKIPLKLKSGLIKEWTTSEELEHVIQHPSEHDIQSILAQLRILSGRSCKAICLAIQDICRNGTCWSILEQDRYVEVLDILWAMLELLRRAYPADGDLKETIVEAYNCLISTLSKMKTNSSVLLNAETIQTSLNLILVTDQFNSYECDDIGDDDDSIELDDDAIYDLQLDSNTFQILRFIALVADLLPQMVLDRGSMDSLGQLVRRKRKNSSECTLLHLACGNPKGINLLETVHLLLQLGADPNAGDKEGNGPLHSLVHLNRELIDPIARLLLEKGAHLDRINKSGKTAVDLWLEKHGSRKRLLDEGNEQGAVGFKNKLPDWCNEGVSRLLCLSARIVRAYRIPYRKVPVTLHPFIVMH